MAITVTRTKIIVPRRRNDLLTRHRLNGFLDDLLDYKLLLISAPAGYGKTSLLVDWSQQNDLPVCWYALDPLDSDLPRFISYLIASISRVFPGFGSQSQASLENYSNTEKNIGYILTAIVNDAYENIKEHFVIVLDDFHTVDASDKVNDFVNRLATEIDENCHLVIASRTLLSLPDLPLMVGRSMVKGLSYEELSFQSDEIQALLLQNYQQNVSDEVAEALRDETEGWITGLLLSAQTMWEGMADRVQVARASGVGLYDYLAQQVLDQQPPVIKNFLLMTSLLEEFDTNLCQAVLGDPPYDLTWFDLIGELLQNNLFVLPVDDKGTWLRYHHLFRDFLQDRISREDPDLTKDILQKLAKVYSDREIWEKACDIYQRIEDRAGIIGLIEEAGTAMLKDRQLNVLKKWLDLLSLEEIRNNPILLSLQGSLDILFGQVNLGISRLDQAEVVLEDRGERKQLALLLLRRSTGHGFLGNYQRVLLDVDRALSIVEGVDELREIYAEAMRSRGLGYYWLGDLGNAIKYLRVALTGFQSLANPQNEALTHVDLGLAYMDSGNMVEALIHYEQALSYWHRTGNIARKVTVLNNIGVLHHLRGEYQQASKNLDETLVLARKSGNIRIEAFALASIGDLYTDLDAFDSAGEAYRLAREISNRINNQRLIIYSYLAEALVNGKRREFNKADELLKEVASYIDKSDSTYEKGLYSRICGQIALEKGYEAYAIICLEEAKGYFEKGGQDSESIQTHLALARAHYRLNKIDQSFSYLGSAIQLAHDTSNYHSLLVACRDAEVILKDKRIPVGLQPEADQLAMHVKEFVDQIPEYRRVLRQQGLVISLEKIPKITIQTLGLTRVSLDGEPVSVPEWRVQKVVRELFFLLLANPQGLSKEEIGLILWPDSSDQQLKIQFKNAVYRLRRALGKGVIVFDSTSDIYKFNWSIDYEYDVENFKNLIGTAKRISGQDKYLAFESAVKLYQGIYLPDGDGVWINSEREELWQMYLQAELALADRALLEKEYHAALSHIHRVLSQDSCQEEAHRLAMKTYAAMGNQADLIRQYEVCKSALDGVFGIPPSKRTEDLFMELLTRNQL